MQRSRQALLLRRASDKFIAGGTTYFYKVSLSLVFVIWSLVVLSSLLISCGDGFKDYLDDIIQCAEPSKIVKNHLLVESKNDVVKVLECRDAATQQNFAFDSADKLQNDVPGSSINDPVNGENSVGDKTLETGALRTSGHSREPPSSLDEFKSKTFSSKSKMGIEQMGSIKHRVEPGGKEYNYASASKGAKVLAYNKESKGAENILVKSKDKYLRNPCSVDDKFVVIELSEETLVDTVMLANFEHYSSNLKDFELLGSKVYPTETWDKLGNFTAPKVKQVHRFTLQDPKWARYLKLKLLSHYGSEFYCTLSVVEVYGDDAMEIMLEDLISTQSDDLEAEKSSNEQKLDIPSSVPVVDNDVIDQNSIGKSESDKFVDDPLPETNIFVSPMSDHAEELRVQQNGRMPSDTILKIIMRKVRSFDINLSVLEKYLEELNSRYVNMFKELDKEIERKLKLLDKIKSDTDNLHESRDLMAKELKHLISWKTHVSAQMDSVIKNNFLLRVEIEEARRIQTWGDTKGFVMFLICILFGSLAVARLFVDVLAVVYNTFFGRVTEDVCWKTEDGKSRKFCYMSSSCFFLLLNCIVIMFIISL